MIPDKTENKDITNRTLYKKVISTLYFFYADVKKNLVVFLSSIILVTGLFLILNLRKSNTYSASFTVLYEELVRKVYGDRLDKIDILLKSNKSKAQSLLNIDPKAMATLKEISSTNIIGEKLSKDINTDRIPFVVNIYLTDTTYTSEIQDGIINYLENGNDYLIDKRKLKIKEIDEELAFIDLQLAMMDTLKRRYYTEGSIKTDPTTGASEGSVYQISYELYKKRQELMKKKEMPMNLYVIDDALIPVRNNKPYILIVFAGIFCGFILYLGMAYLVLPVLRYKES